MTRIDDEFGEALRIARQSAGVTQEDLSAAVGQMGIKLSQATIGKIERGERKVTVGESQALSRALGLYRDELIRGISTTSASVLREQLAMLRDELKNALHAFESGQAIVESRAQHLDIRDQYELQQPVLESIEEVIAEYRHDQEAANAARRHRAHLDGADDWEPVRSSVFTPGAGKPARLGIGHPRALETILGPQLDRLSDG